METPHLLPPIEMQVCLKTLAPFRDPLQRFAPATRVAEAGVEATIEFVGRDGWVLMWSWGPGTVFVRGVDREAAPYVG